MPTHYRHTQVAYKMLALQAGVLGAGIVASQTTVMFAVLGTVLVLVWGLFGALTVIIDGHTLTCHFGPIPLIRRRIPLSSIRQVKAVRTSPLAGWGLRYTGDGWLWNVWGLDAVELQLATGARFRIGTDQPGALVDALEHAGVTRAA